MERKEAYHAVCWPGCPLEAIGDLRPGPAVYQFRHSDFGGIVPRFNDLALLNGLNRARDRRIGIHLGESM